VTQPLSIGIHVPTSAIAPLGSGDAYAEFFRQIEALGFDAVWTEDRDQARASLGAFLHGYYGPRFAVDQYAIFGAPQEVTAQLAEHVQAGMTRLMLGVPTLDLTHLRRVAAEVAPAVRAVARR
jgi:alkanesulfonate monooxygenase SsuD/methylene tetrahydromethanopterin reductase-like flavin-dependent oxidoreductase (luciferase family)